MYYLDLVGNDAKKQVFVMDILPSESKSGIPLERLESLHAGFQHPEKEEGWNEVIACEPTQLREENVLYRYVDFKEVEQSKEVLERYERERDEEMER